MSKRILVINPNSDERVTSAMDRSLVSLRFADGPVIDCMTLHGAPLGIETARDVERVVGPLCRLIANEEALTDAFVIACFGDPGLGAARETTSKPVFGIAEAGLSVALNYGERIGVLTNLSADINSTLRQVRTLGIEARVAGVEAVGVAVVDLGNEALARPAMESAGSALKVRGADVLVLGCAGMVPYTEVLEAQTGLKVINPIHVATTLALGAVS